ncbi:hypothetical protein M222_1444 [Enterococcus faecalis AZ19]|nr:hypothetical protein M222_1444 [Enterococcus faecalis AZ19]
MTSTSSLHVYYNTFSTRRKVKVFLFFSERFNGGGSGIFARCKFSCYCLTACFIFSGTT